ncbi:MAG: hypothetical protein LBE85_09285 [Candidatus Accumulibacter sp.]|jgi:hypothetical protein|nr:hypothetical protein [Accumulibacter sp.]
MSIVYRRTQSEMLARVEELRRTLDWRERLPCQRSMRLTRSNAITPVFWLPRSSC